MTPHPLHRLPAPLEAAVQRLKLAAREAAERSIESLGLAALSATHAFQRDNLLGAQFELNRKSAVFVLTFNDAFDDRVLRELGAVPPGAAVSTRGAVGTSWEDLGLVDDREVEAKISADRFGMEIAVACEWELRELDGYVATVLTDAGGGSHGNPLRPDLVGYAMMRGIEAVSDRDDVRKVLSGEMSRSLGSLLRPTYAGIVADWRNAGLRPQRLAVRIRSAREDGAAGSRDSSHGGASADEAPSERGRGSVHGAGPESRHGRPGSSWSQGPGSGGGPMGQVEPALGRVIRRLAHDDPIGRRRAGPARDVTVAGGDWGAAPAGERAEEGGAEVTTGSPSPLPNLIRSHREELRKASTGTLDHMVIDVIGFLFDQILADPKVPPQMARQIARLQLPVLRAALGDPSFFSSHRHPVRRFINRIAALGAGFDDFSGDAALAFLAKVKALVQDVVAGDFEHVQVYEQKLAALEAHVAELASRELQAAGDVTGLISEKEDQYRLRQLYAQRLAGELKDVEAPAFLRDFVSRVWSQVLLRAAETLGSDSSQLKRMRQVGRELFLSVHPKANAAARKAFLAELPRLMQELTEGMNLIGWPEAQRRAFFGQLMPAHAEALKTLTGRQLDINLLARKVEGALDKPAPSRDELHAAAHLSLSTEGIAGPQFSPEEAQQVGLVDESRIDWDRPLDVDLNLLQPAATPEAAPSPMPGLPASSDPPEPTHGRALADSVQIGFVYQMHLDGSWRKTRLSHVSSGRNFFIFTHGGRHKKTISLTQRMLIRLCETGRLRAFEEAALLDRASSRARKQLAALGAAQAISNRSRG